MEIKRWPTFLALTFSLSCRAFALAQEFNDEPTAPQPVIETLAESTDVVEGKRDPSRKLIDGKEVIEIPNGTGKPAYVLADPNLAGPFHFGVPSKMLIGVSIAEVPDSLRAHLNLAEGTGILVGTVAPESPAAKAGLQRYDILLKAGGHDLKQAKDLLTLVETSESKPISIQFQRRGELKTIEITPVKREELQVSQEYSHPSGIRIAPSLAATAASLQFIQLADGGMVVLTKSHSQDEVTPTTVNAVQIESLSKSIQALTQQVERLQHAIDRLEQKSEAPSVNPPDEKSGDAPQ